MVSTEKLKTLTFFVLSIKVICIKGQEDPPSTLRLDLSEDAAQYYSAIAGTYFLASGLTNDRHFWTSEDGNFAIFWLDNWKLALSSDLGKNTAYIYGPNGNSDWPSNIASGWTYTNANGEHTEAKANDVVFTQVQDEPQKPFALITSGSDVQDWAGETIGRYFMLDDTVLNGSPVYKHEFLELYLFVTQYGTIGVGEDVLQDSYYLLGNFNDDGSLNIEVWNGFAEEWQHDPSITLQLFQDLPFDESYSAQKR